MIGIPVTVVPSTYEENMEGISGSGADIVTTFSKAKVTSIKDKYPEDVIIGADTIVYLNGKAFGKPKNKEDAVQMIMTLGGNAHEVYTGYTVVNNRTGEEVTDYESARVYMRPIERYEAEAYVAETLPFDKAGSYAIQGKAGVFIYKIEGDFFTIVGLPVFKISGILATFGILPFKTGQQ